MILSFNVSPFASIVYDTMVSKLINFVARRRQKNYMEIEVIETCHYSLYIEGGVGAYQKPKNFAENLPILENHNRFCLKAKTEIKAPTNIV